MSKSQALAQFGDKLTFLLDKLPAKFTTMVYSKARHKFMQQFFIEPVSSKFVPDLKWQQKLWGLTFQSPIMNSAGMFKNAEGYDIVNNQGAGGYIGGTSTYNPRPGNNKLGIHLPFVKLAKSNSAVNYLGLPNLGDEILSTKQITTNKSSTCPIGWSVSQSPDFTPNTAAELLIKSLQLYHDNPQIDFIEVNESCPNVKSDVTHIIAHLEYIAQNFLTKRQRHLPVIIKVSNDIDEEALPLFIETLIKCKFDGITIGNTSTDYKHILQTIHPQEQKLFNYFTTNFGGGVSGNILKSRSLLLTNLARRIVDDMKPNHEFHIIRSGGIDSLLDIQLSLDSGSSLCQWYTGYFENFIKLGHNLYQKILG